MTDPILNGTNPAADARFVNDVMRAVPIEGDTHGVGIDVGGPRLKGDTAGHAAQLERLIRTSKISGALAALTLARKIGIDDASKAVYVASAMDLDISDMARAGHERPTARPSRTLRHGEHHG